MGKTDSIAICAFIEGHEDRIGQEEWWRFSDMLLEIVARCANDGGYARQLA